MPNIVDLVPDVKNANKGTKRGNELVERSLRDYGAGRSILIDRNGKIIAGNKTAANAQKAGLQDVIVVQTDGTKLVAVQRTDLDLDTDAQAKALAVADNRTSEIGLEWDPAILESLAGEMDLKPFFTDSELADALGEDLTDVSQHYTGMPEYSSEDQTGVREIIVHFTTEADVKAFANLLEQTILPQTKYLWFPKVQNAELQSLKYLTD